LTEISILYERSETDELGIRYTAEQLGIPLAFLPFHKVGVGIVDGEFTYKSQGRDFLSNIEDTQVIINRTQSKHRRIYASTLLEGYGKHVLNPLQIEHYCQRKIWTMMQFWKNGVKVPDTIYIPCDVKETIVGGGQQDNSKTIMKLISGEIGDKVVLKSDEGTHGKGIYLAENEMMLQEALDKIKPSVINPVGVIAQEYVNKWFYDLRIVVEKRKGSAPFCHPTAMARGGFKDFRTNTFLGNMVFRVNLPQMILEESVKCGEALGKGMNSYVIALDAMPNFTESMQETQDQIMPAFNSLENHFKEVVEAKKTKLNDFAYYTEQVENAYDAYMSSEPYSVVQSAVSESLDKARNSILFHEANACPDFWEQTRVVGGIDIASSLLGCAQSLMDR
jgi:glutathione synthase/RimK-type ligase-like ATP-grasp enzyme